MTRSGALIDHRPGWRGKRCRTPHWGGGGGGGPHLGAWPDDAHSPQSRNGCCYRWCGSCRPGTAASSRRSGSLAGARPRLMMPHSKKSARAPPAAPESRYAHYGTPSRMGGQAGSEPGRRMGAPRGGGSIGPEGAPVPAPGGRGCWADAAPTLLGCRHRLGLRGRPRVSRQGFSGSGCARSVCPPRQRASTAHTRCWTARPSRRRRPCSHSTSSCSSSPPR